MENGCKVVLAGHPEGKSWKLCVKNTVPWDMRHMKYVEISRDRADVDPDILQRPPEILDGKLDVLDSGSWRSEKTHLPEEFPIEEVGSGAEH
ncbi:MAG: hypothetical protein ACLR0U_20150 [Enterocloster clostridioformis]